MAFDVIEQIQTGKGIFELGVACSGHQEEMLHILRATAEQMVKDGRNQWIPELFSLELMDEYLRDREVILLRHEDQPAGMFTLQESDASYWRERNDTRYCYLHRLAVLPAYRGLQLGNRMIAFGENHAARKGKAGLRLDCVTHLDTLNAYYQRQGYCFIAEQDMGGRIVNLYEKTFE